MNRRGFLSKVSQTVVVGAVVKHAPAAEVAGLTADEHSARYFSNGVGNQHQHEC